MEKQIFIQEIRGNFNLRGRKTERPTNIYFVLCINGKQVKIPTGVKVYPHHWNRRKQLPLISSALSELDNRNNAIALSVLETIKTNYQRYKRYLCDHPDELHRAKELAVKIISPMSRKNSTLSPLAVIKKGIISNTTIRETTKGTQFSQIKPFEQFLEAHKIKLDGFDKIDRKLILEYRTYLQQEYINPQGKKNKCSHINALTKGLKTMLRSYAVPDHISTAVVDDIFNKILLPNRVDKRDNEIALRDDEIYKLYNYKAKTKQDECIKDIFIVNCLTGQRISDIEKIEPYTDPDSGANRILLFQKKTGAKVKFDIVFQMAYDILINKYRGELPLKKQVNRLIARNMPRIAREAGIQGTELVTEQRGEETSPTVHEMERWELIKTHTERRTFITLLKLREWDDIKIMQFSGHKNRAMIEQYCKLEPSDYSDFDRLKRFHPEQVLEFTEGYKPISEQTAPVNSNTRANIESKSSIHTTQATTPTEALLIERLEQKAIEAHKMEQQYIEKMEENKRQAVTREAFILETGMTPEDYNKHLEEADHEPTPEEVSFVKGLWN